MVKCKTYGRMGNFLFQAATAIAYALDNELEFTLPDSTHDSFNNPVYLQHLVNPAWDPEKDNVLLCEDGHQWQNLPYYSSWKDHNIILDGYWQSEKYFKHHRQAILGLFEYPWHPKRGVVSVHVRRGDYLRLTQKHPPVPAAWYRRAMSVFPEHTFLFHSDDLAWCREEFGGDPRCAFSTANSIEDDLLSISNCEHQISSASTFSWWGAWLNCNPNKKVIIPERWFTPQEEIRCSTRDIVPEDWIKQP